MALLVYVTGDVVLWAVVYRSGTSERFDSVLPYVVLAIMWLTFIIVTAHLAFTVTEPRVSKAALTSAAAVLAAGGVRVVFAATGMRELLLWDHDNVIVESAIGELFFALFCIVPAAAIAMGARLFVTRRQHRAR